MSARAEKAEKFVEALSDTTFRYRCGYMKRATWKTHMFAIAKQIEDAGLLVEVLAFVDIGTPNGAAIARQGE